MAAFGEKNHGSPLGALSPSGFFNQSGIGHYDYSGFSNRSGWTGFSGFSNASGFSAVCSDTGPEFIPFKPILTYPMNYDTLYGIINITWREAIPQDACGDAVTYELQFTNNFSRDRNWRTIAGDLTQGTSRFELNLDSIPTTDDGGFRIRAIDTKGLASDWSSNAVPFTVANHPPTEPTLIYPVGGETIDGVLGIVWKEAQTRDIDNHRVHYRIDITPAFAADQGWVTVPSGEAISEGSISFTVNSFDFPEGDDYGIRLIAYDELGAQALPLRAGPIRVRHTGTFFIDTVSPQGTLLINDGDPLTKDSRIKLDIFGFDVTTGVKDMRLRNSDEGCWSDWDTYVPEKFWDLSNSDGLKRVFVQLRDYAGNISEACDCEIVSRVLCDEGNAVDLEVFNNRLYVAFDANGNVTEYRALANKLSQLEQPQVLAMSRITNALIVAAYDPDADASTLYQYDSTYRVVASGINGKIVTMATYNSNVYMGLSNGKIMKLTGSAVSTEYVASHPVTRLRTDGDLLYAALDGGGAYLVFNGVNWTSNVI